MTPDISVREENTDRKIIIKGGPGTGKSTLMKKFADEAERKGYAVTEYYCSSDPDSLDAVTVTDEKGTVILCDGTAPHVSDPVFPGAVSEIIDLTHLWDSEKLTRCRSDVIELIKSKKRCFDKAYRLLDAASVLRSSLKDLLREIVDNGKIERFSKSTASKEKTNTGEGRRVYTETISMKGMVMLDTLLCKADRVIFVKDRYGCADYFLTSLVKSLEDIKAEYTVSICPYDSTKIDSVYMPGSGKLYTSVKTERSHRNINTQRFIRCEPEKIKSQYRYLENTGASLLNGAASHLREASEIHFSLEKLFSEAMDFKAVNKLYKERILKLI